MTSETIASLYRDGAWCARAGLPATACPYGDFDSAAAWLLGYHEQDGDVPKLIREQALLARIAP